jgi:thiol-disulfide isomerase/thioredoxin
VSQKRLRPVLLGLVCAALLCAPGCGSDAKPIPRENRPHALPSAKAVDLPEGIEEVDAAKLLRLARAPKSRGLVVNVWASWCGSCRQEVPMLLALRDKLASKHVRVEFVSADEPQAFPKVLELVSTWNVGLPALAVAANTIGNFKRALSPDWRGGIPATFLIDAQGKLRHLWEGPILEEEVAPVVERYLAGDAVDGVTRTAAEPR